MGHRRSNITRRFGDALLLQRQSMTARAVTSSVNRDESHNSLFLSNRSSAVASAIGLHLPKNRPTSDCTNGAIHRHRQKTAEERLYMLARGWLAYPVTPVAHATTAEERLYMLTPTASGGHQPTLMRRGRAAKRRRWHSPAHLSENSVHLSHSFRIGLQIQ